jgi:outer membrane protein
MKLQEALWAGQLRAASRAFCRFCAASALVAGLGVPSVSAETLKEALTAAYLFNPTLKAARAQLRSIDENVPRALSGYRPRVTGDAQHGFEDTSTRIRGDGRRGSRTWPRQYSIEVDQMLFDGFQTFNAVKGAEALVEAGREDLRSTEQQVLFDSATAFMDVVRDQALLELQQNNVKVLNEQLRATNDRFQVGEVTKTDVAQARAAVSAADSAVSAARANLQLSRSNFQRLIGHTPVGLKSPSPANKLIPAKMEQAIALGEAQNPTVLASLFRERSSIHDVKQIKGELLPRVTLQGRYTKGYDTSATTVEVDDTTVTADVTVPLYQAGEVSARIRQAQEVRSQRLQQIDEAREQVRSNVVSGWGQWTSTKAQIESDKAQVESNRIALEGVREEERVGQRTVLDVLNAEQAYLNAQVALVTSRRDHIVASYQLLTAIGRASAYDIALKTEMYDPAAYYSEVRDKRYGWHTTVEPEDPEVGRVLDPGLVPGQDPKLGPAYTHKPGCAEARRESCR